MSEIDHVFARLGGAQTANAEQREQRSIPRRGGATGNRVVEVVRLPSRGTAGRQGEARHPNSKGNAHNVHAQSWEDGFPARSAPPPPPAPEAPAPEPAEPAIHLMPMWERSEAARETEPAAGTDAPTEAEDTAEPAARPAREAARRVADPFDAEDERANCLRCGHVVEVARERRGLMTCAACG